MVQKSEPSQAENVGGALEKIRFIATKFDLAELGSKFVPFLNSSNTTIQYVALSAIGELKPANCAGQVAKLLSCDEWPIGRSALDTLVKLHAPEAIPTLVTRLDNADGVQRYIAIKNLAEIGCRDAAPALASHFGKETGDMRYWIIDALGKIGAIPELHLLLTNQPTVAQQGQILAWLAHLNDGQTMPDTAQLVIEGGRIDTATIRQALVKIAAVEICPVLAMKLREGKLRNGEPIDNALCRDAALFMAQLGSREAIPFLCRFVPLNLPHPVMQMSGGKTWRSSTSTHEEVERDRVVEALGQLRAEAAATNLIPLQDVNVAGTVYSVRIADVALSRIGNRESIPVLLDHAQDTSNPVQSQILLNLNVALDERLWNQVEESTFQWLYVMTIDAIAAKITTDSKIAVTIDYRPPDEKSWPKANSHVGNVKLGLEQIISALSRTEKTPYTAIIRNKTIHVLPVDEAIKEWRTLISQKKLIKSNK